MEEPQWYQDQQSQSACLTVSFIVPEDKNLAPTIFDKSIEDLVKREILRERERCAKVAAKQAQEIDERMTRNPNHPENECRKHAYGASAQIARDIRSGE